MCVSILFIRRHEAMLCSTAVRFEQNSAEYERLLDELALILAPELAPPEARRRRSLEDDFW